MHIYFSKDEMVICNQIIDDLKGQIESVETNILDSDDAYYAITLKSKLEGFMEALEIFGLDQYLKGLPYE